MQKYPIREVEGVGDTYEEKLKMSGIETTIDLLEKARTTYARKKLAKNIGISEKLILDWANRADLMRINGIARQYSDLLEAAGVDTVVELSHRNPENLYEQLRGFDVSRSHKVRQKPSKRAIRMWVEQAKQMERMLE